MTSVERLLGALVADAAIPGAQVRGDAGVTVSGVVYDSRRVAPGSLFCCLRGATVDGHTFAEGAVRDGASALLTDHALAIDVPQVVVADTRAAMGHLAAAFWGHPANSLVVVGVTGTNGKTTTTNLLASTLEAAGMRCGVIGTLTGVHTTPEAPDLQERLAGYLADGCAAVAMEVSSHALALHRVDGCHFAVSVFF